MDGKRLERISRLFLHFWPVLLVIVILFIKIPLFFEPFTYGDEGVYLTLGQAVRKGLILYRDIYDNKPPLIYLIAAAAGNFSSYRAIYFFWSLITIYCFNQLAGKLFPKKKIINILVTSVFALFFSLRLFEGNVANAENFMIGFTIMGFLLYLKLGNWQRYFTIGLLFSISTLLKIPAAFDFAALMIFILLSLNQKNFRFTLLSSFSIVLGYLLPILTTFIYFLFQHSLSQYLRAAFFQNLPYLSSWASSKMALYSRALLVFIVVLMVWVYRKKLSQEAKLIIIWFSFSLFAALLSSRPYPHYLIQVLPPLTLSLALFWKKNKEKYLPLIIMFIFTGCFFLFRFWHYPSVAYYRNFYRYVFKNETREQYFNNFDTKALSLYQTAAFIKRHTKTDEKIFMWGNYASLYPLTNRLPLTFYTVAYHIIDFNGYQLTIEKLKEQPPRYIVIEKTETRPFPELFSLLKQDYLAFWDFQYFQIYLRK